MSNNNYKDLFKKACLVQLSSSIWQCSRAIDPKLLEQIGENHEWLRGRKYLINPELLGPIRTAVHQARNMVNRFSLPFPITSIYLIPKDNLQLIDQRLNDFKGRFWGKFAEFEAMYEAAREEAKQMLGELFDETEYPQDISTKFNFEWRYLILGIPGKTSVLTPEIYEREKQNFQNLMEETREIAMEALRVELGDIVTNLVARLDPTIERPKAINNAVFNKLREFLDEFGNRNIFDDDKLVELAEQAKAAIEGVSPYNIKYNDVMRKRIANEMNKLKEAVDESIEDLPRRKLRMAS